MYQYTLNQIKIQDKDRNDALRDFSKDPRREKRI